MGEAYSRAAARWTKRSPRSPAGRARALPWWIVHPRIRLALASVLAIVVVGLAAAVVFGRAGGSGSSAASASGLEGGQIDIPARNFSLVDQNGHRASLAEYRGQVVILTFMYSTCQNTCPVEAQQIRGALDDLGENVPTLAVSVDPAQDTPINAQRFLFKESLTGRMRFLLGTRAELAPIWKAYGIAPETGTNLKVSNHSAYVMLVDRRGWLRDGFPDSELTPEALAHDIRVLQSQPA
jgi:protein SCO1